ncbi:hypothetical protein ACYQR9_00095 (plasmid) [Methylobacterium sp. CM6241]
MYNPLARLVQRDPAKPTLRERAGSLKASAARVIRRPKPVEAAPVVDWNSPPEGFVAYPHDEPEGFLRIDLALASETKRLHGLALSEFERRSSAWDDYDASMKAGQLDKLRRHLRLDELARAADPAKVIPTEFEPRDGTIVYEDVSGRARRAPVADWISFMALRMFGVARQESGRLFNERAGTDQEAIVGPRRFPGMPRPARRRKRLSASPPTLGWPSVGRVRAPLSVSLRWPARRSRTSGRKETMKRMPASGPGCVKTC